VRALATWLVAGAVVVVGVAAVADAVRGDRGAASWPSASGARSGRPGGPPPAIPNRTSASARLLAAGAAGVLEVTDGRCRRFRLRLPELAWTSPSGERQARCLEPVVRAPGGELAAFEEGEDVIAFSDWPGWQARFEGTAPSFRPDGILTFLRHGELFEWSGRCPGAARLVNFRTEHEVRRCVRSVLSRRVVASKLRRLGLRMTAYYLTATAWLGVREVATVVRGRFPEEAVVALFENGRVRAVFPSYGTRLGRLEGSPAHSYLAATLAYSSEIVVLDRRLRVRQFPRGVAAVRALSWSPDERWAAAVTPDGVELFRADGRGLPIHLALHAARVEWR